MLVGRSSGYLCRELTLHEGRICDYLKSLDGLDGVRSVTFCDKGLRNQPEGAFAWQEQGPLIYTEQEHKNRNTGQRERVGGW